MNEYENNEMFATEDNNNIPMTTENKESNSGLGKKIAVIGGLCLGAGALIAKGVGMVKEHMAKDDEPKGRKVSKKEKRMIKSLEKKGYVVTHEDDIEDAFEEEGTEEE